MHHLGKLQTQNFGLQNNSDAVFENGKLMLTGKLFHQP
jgi:hypothetical protein